MTLTPYAGQLDKVTTIGNEVKPSATSIALVDKDKVASLSPSAGYTKTRVFGKLAYCNPIELPAGS